jgi:Putative zinc-finger
MGTRNYERRNRRAKLSVLTKVNRCLSEGRKALVVRLAGIEGGIECAKLARLLSALADHDTSPEQLALLRRHMDTCLSCRARLRSLRAARKPGQDQPPSPG